MHTTTERIQMHKCTDNTNPTQINPIPTQHNTIQPYPTHPNLGIRLGAKPTLGKKAVPGAGKRAGANGAISAEGRYIKDHWSHPRQLVLDSRRVGFGVV
jgi:hypothetical protein